ncbi:MULTISPECIES: type VII secretion protein EssC [Clostridium]|uniref:type VII secretion protein EssC n=1 Tax=Clostridium TaxID=1485 RepID=UPI0008250183|nr:MULTISPECIES: type VII secretion protein EssC [Clostridium]PJI07949.1 type VII secretion protein EssC [Clostridium sp. CT7]
MNMKLLVYSNEKLYEVLLSASKTSVSIGNRKRFKYYIKTNEKNCIKIKIKSNKKNEFILMSKQFISSGGKETEILLEHGKIMQFGLNGIMSITIIAFSMDKLINTVKIPLKENIKFTIGRAKFNDIVFDDIKVSEKHAEIFEDNGKYVIVDLNSTNKTYLNGKMITRAILSKGDKVDICGYIIIFNKEFIIVEGALKNIKKASGFEKLIKEYPFVQKAPRIYPEIKKEDLKIENPPSLPTKPSLYGLMTFLPSVIFLAVTVITSLKDKSGSSSMIFAVGTGISGLMYGFSYFGQKIVYNKKSKKRNRKYISYIREVDKKLLKAEKNLREVLFEQNPDLNESIEIVKNSTIRLWTRSYGDEDFLLLRVGLGNEDFPLKIVKEKRNFFDEDHLLDEMDKVTDKYNLVDNVPICAPIRDNQITAVIGNRDKAIETIKNMILQISINHTPDEVKLVVIFDDKELKHWEWVKWLPHAWDDNKSIRFMAENKEQTHRLLSTLYDVLSDRKNKLEDKNNYESYRFSPHFVFVLASRELIENEAILKFLLNVDSDMEISTIFLSDKLGNVPRSCNNIIQLNEGEGVIYNIQNSSEKSYFTPDRMDSKLLMQYSRIMAPLRLEKDSYSNKLPNSISLFEELDIKNVDEINFGDIWSKAVPYKSLSVPIGIRENGEKFYLDLHQKQHGPHGLVAGTTGAGKSELLETIIAALSFKISPEYVNFLLIDYKGGSMSNVFKNLPHVVGIVTNLEGNGSKRAIIAIDSEIKRREKILTENSYNNIDEYEKNYKLKKHKMSLPHLIIIVDEFAQLKKNDPDFISQLVNVAVVGRSLGVHLILATQKPSGIVDPQIETNTNLKICLRVQDNDDSRTVIGKPDASSISNPGRAYIKVGNDMVYELIQTAFAGAKYKKTLVSKDKKVLMVDIDGTRFDVIERAKETQSENVTQLSKLIDVIKDYSDLNMNYEKKLPWLPPLINSIYLEDFISDTKDEFKAKMGIYDDPYNQLQDVFEIDIQKENYIALYGMAGTGKTIFLETFILSLAGYNSPKNINFYIADCDKGTLNMFKNLVHVGEIALSDDADRMKKLLKFIIKQIDKRKAALTSIGAVSINDYNYKTGKVLPQIVFIIDDVISLISLDENFRDDLVKIVREGGSLGVHVVYTASTSGSVPIKIKENVSFCAAYSLNDSSEYREIFGRNNGIVPDKIAGRGVLRNKNLLEFQTALPVKAEEFDWSIKIGEKIENINKTYPNFKVKGIPVLKEVLPLYDFIHDGEFLDYGDEDFRYNNDVPVGVDIDEMESVFVDFSSVDSMLISGDIGCGKTNFLMAFIMTLAETRSREKNKIFIIDSPENNMLITKKLNCVDGYLEDKDGVSKCLTSIREDIEERKKELRDLRMEYGVDANKKIIENKGNLFLIVDVINKFKERFSDEAAVNLEWIMANNKGTGVHVIAADNINLFTRAWEGIEKTIKSWETGIIFSTNVDSVFSNVNIGFQYSKKILNLGEGFLIVNRKATPIKIPTPYEGKVKFIDYIDKLNRKLN